MKKLAAIVGAVCLFGTYAIAQHSGSAHEKSRNTILTTTAHQKQGVSLQHYHTKDKLLLGVNVVSSLGFSGSHCKDGTKSVYQTTITPRVGFRLDEHFTAGLLFQGTFAKTRDYNSESYGAGGFVRWYAGKMMRENGTLRKARFFVDAGITFNGGEATFKNAEGIQEKVNFSNATPYIMPGFNYFFTKHFALEAGLQLNHTTYRNNGGGNFSDNSCTVPVIGLHYFSGR